MRVNRLGKTDLHVSELGFGCSPLGGGLSQPISNREASYILDMAVSAGVNFFDTADNYGLGESERRLGRAFKSRRDAVVIATKGGAWFRPMDRVLQRMRLLFWPVHRLVRNAPRRINAFRDQRKRYDYTPEHLTQAVEASLRRLATDYIDLYQLYNPGWDDLLALQIDALVKLQEQGKIRHFGVSVDSVTDTLGGAGMDIDCSAARQCAGHFRRSRLFTPRAGI